MIRKAYPQDIPSLLEIEELCFEPGDRFNKRQFQRAIKRELVFVWTATHNRASENPPMGYLHYIKPMTYFCDCKHLRLYSLAVNPTYQGMGIGEKLLDHLHTTIVWWTSYPRNPVGIFLECRTDNPKAIAFYEKHGYKKIGIKHNYYSDGTDAVKMKRTIDVNGR